MVQQWVDRLREIWHDDDDGPLNFTLQPYTLHLLCYVIKPISRFCIAFVIYVTGEEGYFTFDTDRALDNKPSLKGSSSGSRDQLLNLGASIISV